ncbi:MAG: ABC transporter ATP-binding protein [Promethearchaeota archaeon]
MTGLEIAEFYSGFLINKLERLRNKQLVKRFDKTLRKHGKSDYTRSKELNTFIVAHAHLNAAEYEDTDTRKRLEAKLFEVYHKKYLNQIKANRRRAIKKDIELNESKKALLRAIRHLPQPEAEELKEQIEARFEELLTDINRRFDEMYDKTLFTLWDLPGVEEDRLVLYNRIINRPSSIEGEHEAIGELVDELALIIFGNQFLPNLKTLLKGPLSLAESGVQILTIHRPLLTEPASTDQHKDDLTNALRVLQGKVLGLRDIIKVSKREVARFRRILDEVNAEADFLQSESIKEVAREFIDLEAIEDRFSDIERIELRLGDLASTLRDLVHDSDVRPIKREAKHNPLEAKLLQYILDFYIALESIRFWTDTFADIPQFTVLKGGVAFEYGEVEDKSVPEDSVLYGTDIFKQYKLPASTVYALRGCDIDIKRGEFVSIIGPSGSGKTTMLNILSGLDLQDRGEVYIDGVNLRTLSDNQLTALRRDKMGFIFQFYNLLPVLTNQENVGFPADLAGKTSRKKERSSELLENVGLGRFCGQFPNKLSGGQMQRVTVARSLMNNPAVLFADEPTGDLDSVTGEEILKLLQAFHKQGSTIVLVTHDLNIAQHAERIILMKDGQIQDIDHKELEKMII